MFLGELARRGTDSPFDILHVRYDAAHRGAESDILPHVQDGERPGLVSFTATRWGSLLSPKKMPPGEQPLTATDRFVLSNQSFDVCITGPFSDEQLVHALRALEAGALSEEQMIRVKRIGDYVRAATKM